VLLPAPWSLKKPMWKSRSPPRSGRCSRLRFGHFAPGWKATALRGLRAELFSRDFSEKALRNKMDKIYEAMQGVYSLYGAYRLFPNPGSKASAMQAGHVISTIEI
jgi:hypothetical protein